MDAPDHCPQPLYPRKLFVSGLSLIAGLLISTGSLIAAELKTVTISGDGICAKCTLHESHTCQTVITTTEDGKQVLYYVVKKELTKNFHKNVCKASVKVTATGTVEVKDGKNLLTATKIEVVK